MPATIYERPDENRFRGTDWSKPISKGDSRISCLREELKLLKGMQAEKNAKPPTRASGAWGGNGETLAQVMQVLSNNDEWTAAKVAEVCRVAKTTTYRHLENLVAKGLAEKREHQFAGQGSATALYRLKGTPQGTPDTEARLRVAPALRALMISEGPVTVRQAMKATGFAESGIRSAITRMVSAGEVVCKKGDRRLKVYSLAEE